MKNIFVYPRFSWSLIMMSLMFTLSKESEAQISCTDNYEPNDSKQHATTIMLNTTYHALIQSTLDVDWFTFDITSDQPNVTVTLFNLPKNYNLFLYNLADDKLASSKHKNTTPEVIIENNLLPGSYYVKVRGKAGTFDAANCYYLKTETSSTPFKESENLHNLTNANSEYEIYPNPAFNILHIECKEDTNFPVTFSIFNLLGERVYEEEKIMEGNMSVIDLSSLENGEYFLEVRINNKTELKKFIIIR